MTTPEDANTAVGGSALSEGLGAVSEARKPTALLNWSLHVDCPKCSLSNDLASSLHDGERTAPPAQRQAPKPAPKASADAFGDMEDDVPF